MSYSDLLKHPEWQKKRLELMKARGWSCSICTDTSSNLQIHHLYYKRDSLPWEYPDNAFQVVCSLCHEKLEFERFINKHLHQSLFEDNFGLSDILDVKKLIKRRLSCNYHHQSALDYMSNIKLLING